MTDPQLELARTRAAAARQRLVDTAQELQYRLKPATIATEATQVLRRKGTELAEDAADAVRKRPVAISATVGGIGALLGLGLIARWRGKGEKE